MNGNPKRRPGNTIETVLVVFLLLALLVALYHVLYIFFGVLTFALVFAITFEKFYEWLVLRLKNKRKLSAFVYTLLLITIIALPLGFLFSSLTRNVKPVIDWVNEVKENGLPSLPSTIAKIPVAGNEIEKLWNRYHDDPKQIISDHQQQVQQLSRKAMTSGFSILQTILEVIIGIIISALLLVKKKSIKAGFQLPIERLLGKESGTSLLDAISIAVRGVSIGVIGTALIAAVLSFTGLAIAGVHFAVGLSAIVFFLVMIQIGPLPLWIPLAIWMAAQEHPGTAVFILIWGIGLSIVDAVIKPILIGKSGGRLPFLVLFLGVVGGLAAWGFTGMFKGAIILAVFYTVYNSWLGNRRAIAADKSMQTE